MRSDFGRVTAEPDAAGHETSAPGTRFGASTDYVSGGADSGGCCADLSLTRA